MLPAVEMFAPIETLVNVTLLVFPELTPTPDSELELRIRLVSERLAAVFVDVITGVLLTPTSVAPELLLAVMVILRVAVRLTLVNVEPPANCNVPLSEMNEARLLKVEPADTLI